MSKIEENQSETTITAEEVGLHFIFPIWRCLNADVKKKYGADTWSMFENFVRSAAAQPTLPLFLEKLRRVIRIDWRTEEQSQVLRFIQNSPAPDSTLKLLRTQTAYIILVVRDANTSAKEAAGVKAAASVTQFQLF